MLQRLLAGAFDHLAGARKGPTDTELVRRVRAAFASQSVGKGGKHVLIACFPKSSSTFLSSAIGNLPGFNNVPLVFRCGRREQELDPFQCAVLHDSNYASQAHVRYSSATDMILKAFDIFPVILVRNIFDCVVSLCDHYHNEDAEGSMAYLPPQILGAPREKQFDAIISLVLPWYANFFACWSDYKGPALRMTYNEIAENPNAAISKIMAAIDVDVSPSTVEEVIKKTRAEGSRFNVGRLGRGAEQLSAEQVARIRELFSPYSHLEGIDEILRA